MYSCIYIYRERVRIQIDKTIYIYTYIHMYMCMHIYKCVYIHICMAPSRPQGHAPMFSIATAAHKGDLPLGLSELLGANMFMLCITGGVICLIPAFISPHATAELEQGVSTARLVGTAAIYGLAMGMLGWLVFTSNPTLLKACCLPAVYALYLFMLWCLRDDSAAAVGPGPSARHGQGAGGGG